MVMSPPIQLTTSSTMAYTPTSDALDRHEYGVSKNRKLASTGGGRAWSEEEEVYLLQTRLQKMPYKHIAAHLKKTELACRLHYHQLSHGSNRRKRTASVSSSTSSTGQSPIMPVTMPSPIQEYTASVRDASSPESTGSYAPASPNSRPSSSMQLPSILGMPSQDTNRLPAILPKPTGSGHSHSLSTNSNQREYPAVGPPAFSLSGPHPRGSLGPSPFPPQSSSVESNQNPPLRLDCSQATTPRPHSYSASSSSASPPSTIDLPRLQSIYQTHRGPFWNLIAAKYGDGTSPAVLEDTFWRDTAHRIMLTQHHQQQQQHQPQQQNQHQQQQQQSTMMGPFHHYQPQPQPQHSLSSHNTPITPVTSPNDRESSCEKGSMLATSSSSAGSDRTRISAILGINANPRSPGEREIVKRLEEERAAREQQQQQQQQQHQQKEDDDQQQHGDKGEGRKGEGEE